MSTCKDCAYNLGKECQILNNKQIGSCFAKADFQEVKKREKDIEKYKQRFLKYVLPKKTVREKLDERFSELYFKNYSDIEIAKTLQVSSSSVGNYRKKLKLPVNKKSLREQANKK